MAFYTRCCALYTLEKSCMTVCVDPVLPDLEVPYKATFKNILRPLFIEHV